MSTEPHHAGQHGITSALDALVDEFVSFFETYGVRGTIARVWALLYLAPAPLGQEELRVLTGLSSGMVSTALRELEEWGAIVATPVTGSRRLLYEAEPELLPVLRRILRQRDLEAVRRLRAAVGHAREGYHPPLASERLDARLRAVEQAADLFEAFFSVVEGISRLPGLFPGALATLRRAARLPLRDER